MIKKDSGKQVNFYQSKVISSNSLQMNTITDYSIASATGLLNIHKIKWDATL
jgi:glycerol kinase